MAIDTVASAVSIAAEGSIGDTIGDSAANLGTSVEMSTLIPLIKQGVVGVLEMASSAFNFLIQNARSRCASASDIRHLVL